MSVVARLEVIPTREGSMSEAVASAVEALEEFDVSYETTPTDTVVEADDPGEVFAAAAAAHRAVSEDRVVTSLEVDDQRTRSQRRQDRVASVERHLGRPAKRERTVDQRRRAASEGRAVSEEQVLGETGAEGRHPGRYGGPWQSGSRGESDRPESRYLRPKRPVSR